MDGPDKTSATSNPGTPGGGGGRGDDPGLEPDPGMIRQHLDRLFRRCPKEYPGGRVEIAWAETTGAVRYAQNFPTTPEGLDDAVACAVQRNREKRNVYVGVNPRKPGTRPDRRGSKEDVEIAFFNFVECDKFESGERLRQAPLPYSFAVTSGRKPHPRPHAYIELDKPTRDMARWSKQQRGMCDYVGGDPVIDPPRIMRLAGTVNYPVAHKVDRGYQIELVTIHTLYENDAERVPVSAEAVATAFPWSNGFDHDHQKSNGFDHAAGQTGNDSDHKPHFGETDKCSTEALINAIRSGDQWHNNMIALVGRLVNQGYQDCVILGLADRLTHGVKDTGLRYTTEDTEAEIANLLRRDRANWDIPNPDDDTEDFNAPPPEAPGLDQIVLADVESILARDIPAPDYLLGELLSTTSRALLIAPTGLGKTNFGMAIAQAMATETPFLHWRVMRRARVLYIDGEMSIRLMRGRVEDMIRRAKGVIPCGFNIINRDDFPDLPPLNTAAGQHYIDRFIELKGGFDFIFFDNIQALLVGDMAKNESWAPIIPWLWSLTRRGIGQLWIHHTGNDESHGYGDKTREWQLDTVMLLERVEQQNIDISFKIKFTKARERTPENRADYAPVTISLIGDQWHADDAPPRMSGKLGAQAKKFLDALIDALAHGGKPRITSATRPSVTMTEWRDECFRLGLLDKKEPDNRIRALFSKYRRELIGANKIVCNDEYVWIRG